MFASALTQFEGRGTLLSPSKESDLFPWLYEDKLTNNIRFNKTWAQQIYRPEKDVEEHISSNN